MEEATKIIVEQVWNWGHTLNTISTFIMALCTIVIAVFTISVWKVYKQILFLTSTAETHSEMMLKIEAKRDGIPIVWWDPTIEKVPVEREHRKEIDLERIHFYIPKELRKGKKKV